MANKLDQIVSRKWLKNEIIEMLETHIFYFRFYDAKQIVKKSKDHKHYHHCLLSVCRL